MIMMNELNLKVNTEVNTEVILPVNTGVIVEFYDKNPYLQVEKRSSGLTIGSNANDKYKSNETGEIEDNIEIVACAKVIAVGIKCQNVSVGDDVFCNKHLSIPLPYRNKKYRKLDEQHIACIIKKSNNNDTF